jgi:hypothetical protein
MDVNEKQPVRPLFAEKFLCAVFQRRPRTQNRRDNDAAAVSADLEKTD